MITRNRKGQLVDYKPNHSLNQFYDKNLDSDEKITEESHFTDYFDEDHFFDEEEDDEENDNDE
jgi:hypothetical protein